MKLIVTGEAQPDINVAGGQKSRVIEINTGAVFSVNGQSGNVNLTGLTDWINVSVDPYSAKGDGVQDDTDALQKAIDACPPGGTVYLPRGVYTTTRTLDLRNGVSLQGAHANLMVGPGMTGSEYPCYIQPAAGFTGTSVIQIIGDADGTHPNISGEQRITNLMLDGSQLGGSSIDGLYARGNVQNVVLDNVTIRQMPNNGIVTASRTDGTFPFSWRLRHVVIDNCHANGILVTGCTDLTLDDVQAIGCWGQGFILNNCPNGQLTGCRAEWNGSHGYRITGAWGDWHGSGGMQITGCSTDRNGRHGMLIDATGNTPIIITGLMTRRDGRNGGAGAGGFAGLAINGATVPVTIDGITCYPGVDDDGSGTNSPQYGATITDATLIQVDNAYLHADTAGLNDDGTSTVILGNNITYATGGTSAPMRSPQAGPAGTYNVRHFGARGDGVTDDTAAVQRAINAGGITFFPPGVYLVSTLEAKLGMVLAGVTRSAYTYPVPATQSSTLKLKTGSNGHLIHAADGINNVQIHDLAFDGNKAGNSSGDLIHLDSATAQDTSWHIVDCYFDNSPHDGISVGSGRQAVKMCRTWIMRSANNGITLNGADAGLDTVLIGLSGANGVYIGGWVEHLSNCDIWSSQANGVVCDNVNQVSLVNCGIDRHRQAGLVVQGGGAVSVIGCMFHSNSQQADNTYPHISITGGAVTVIGTQFGYDGLTNNPDWAIKSSGTVAVLDWGNRILANSTAQGYISNPGVVQNVSGGSIALPIGTQVNVGGSSSPAAFAVKANAASDFAFASRVGADTSSRFAVNAAGTHTWGNGTATDVTLARDVSNRLNLSTADFRIGTVGRGLMVAEGANAKMGTATLNGTTNVTVATTAVTANSRIYLTAQNSGASGTPGTPRVSGRTAGASFTVTSTSGTDTSLIAWMIVEPA